MIFGLLIISVLWTFINMSPCGLDSVGLCSNLKSIGLPCHNDYMKKNCKTTCCNTTENAATTVAAPQPTPCDVDKISFCSLLTSNGAPCNNNYMKENCKATCCNVTAKCGQSMVPQSRVINGIDAKDGAWPWLVSLHRKGQFICGGTLISPQWVVTAAHCMLFGNPDKVILGDPDRSNKNGNEQEFNIANIILHSGFRLRPFDNDIALIKLNRPAVFSSVIQPACFPDFNATRDTSCFIVGWGKISPNGTAHNFLQQAKMKIVDQQICDSKNIQETTVTITDNMICGGGLGKISGCHGDSGGPLLCNSNGRWQLHGVVSHVSKTCDKTKAYTVFTRVSPYKKWIKEQINVGSKLIN